MQEKSKYLRFLFQSSWLGAKRLVKAELKIFQKLVEKGKKKKLKEQTFLVAMLCVPYGSE